VVLAVEVAVGCAGGVVREGGIARKTLRHGEKRRALELPRRKPSTSIVQETARLIQELFLEFRVKRDR
jgi:hypothetical protein